MSALKEQLKKDGWIEIALGEICDVKGGKRLPKGKNLVSFKTDHPYIRITDLENNQIKKKQLQFVTEDVFKSISRYIVNTGDIIISIVGSIGFVAFIDQDLNNASLTENCVKFVNLKKIDPKFLYYFLISRDGQEEINKNTVGAVQKKLPIYGVQNIKINLPSLSEQQSIASLLSSFDEKIELLREENKTLEEIGQTIFKEWFGKYGFERPEELPEGWRLGKLGEIVEFINGYAFKSEDLLSEDTGNCYKIFKMGNIRKGGGFEESKTKSYIKKEDFKGQEKYILKQGDLLMSMTDMKDAISLLGHTALMIYDDEYVVNQRVGLIRASNDINIGFPFFYLLTNNKDFIANLRGRANSGVQINLSTEAIKKSEFLIPDKETNEKFNDIVKPMFQKIRDNEIQIQFLARSRDEILPRLMNGEVRV